MRSRQHGPINRHAIHGPENSESEHQQALISWARDTAKLESEVVDVMKRDALQWLHSVPNGGGRGKAFITKRGAKLPPLLAVKLKAEGQVAGINDLRLDYVLRDAAGHITCPGLIAEMKKPREKLTTEQRSYQQFMMRLGFVAYTWFTWQRAAYDIAVFMQLERFAPIYLITNGNRMEHIGKLEVLNACPITLF